MKRVDRTFGVLAAGVGVVMMLGLGAGCASSAASNRRVYDRYAELVAARNRAAEPSGAAAAAPAASRPDSPKAVAASEGPKAKPEPAKAAPAKPEASSPPKAEPAKPAATPAAAPVKPEPAKPVPAPAPVARPEPAPPVQVVVPKPMPSPAPIPVAAPEPEAVPARPSSVESAAYQLKVGDLVQVFLRGIPGGESIEDIIDEDGQITLPLINEVQAAGMSPSDLERNIRKIYMDLDIYRNINVTVVVPARYFFIQGEIRGPGRYQITSAVRVSQAIAGAGGYSEYASGRVIVKRGGKIIKNIRNARRLDRTPEDDILLEPDDIVDVRRSLW